MSSTVGTLWGIYIIVVVISFLIFWLFLGTAQSYYNSVGYGIAFFLSTILGAFAVFIGAAWLDPNQLSSSEKTSLSVLFVIAFLLPNFVVLYIVWAGEYASFTTEDSGLPSCTKKDPCPKNNLCETHTEKLIHCDRDTGLCHVKKEIVYQGDNVTTVVYSSNKH